MKKMIPLTLSLLVIAGLPACGGKQKPQPVHVEKKQETKRISGPLAEKEVGWEQEDYQ
jgi:hypothetical protein